MKKIILVAGGTGNLGARIVKALLERGATVRAIVRASTDIGKIRKLETQGVEVFKVNMLNVDEVSKACVGVSCVVSALSGLEDVIITTQKVILDAAISAAVPRFISSDYSLDFTKLPAGRNRNLDLRRTFHQYIDSTSIAATSIFNGPFTELLVADMPMILFKQKRILYWGNADHQLDFTTMDNTAAFTANVALDDTTARFLNIHGDSLSARNMVTVVSGVTGKKFKLLRAGGLGLLSLLIKITKTLVPGKKELYPAWQGMQYMRDMMDEAGIINQYHKNKYIDMKWTSVKDFLLMHE